MRIKNCVRNVIGILIVRYIIRRNLCDNTEGWIVTRKSGEKQIIKVFSVQAYKNIIRPVLGRREDWNEI